jgi:NAD+ diphosphatase
MIAPMPDLIPFSGDPLDRAGNEKRNPEWVAQKLAAPETRFLPFWKLNALTTLDDDPRLLWLDRSVLVHQDENDHPVLLGLKDDVAHFAVDLSPLADPIVELGVEGGAFNDTRAVAPKLGPDAGTLAHGRSMLDWHARHRFCPKCGNPTEPRDAGASRKCESCEAEHFPRTDPVVIMVVWRGNKCILGRQKAWAPGFYSALAGFIDQGETIEDAVRREVKEEVGLEVDEVQYRASQPWPFPSSLMIGCFAHATGDHETVDAFELDGARWFTRDEIKKAIDAPDPSLGYGVPGKVAIAHHIINDWSEQPDVS